MTLSIWKNYKYPWDRDDTDKITAYVASFINNIGRDVYDEKLVSRVQTSSKRNTKHSKTANMLLLTISK